MNKIYGKVLIDGKLRSAPLEIKAGDVGIITRLDDRFVYLRFPKLAGADGESSWCFCCSDVEVIGETQEEQTSWIVKINDSFCEWEFELRGTYSDMYSIDSLINMLAETSEMEILSRKRINPKED